MTIGTCSCRSGSPDQLLQRNDPLAVRFLELRDFRCFEHAHFEPDPSGLSVLRGPNGSGKTSVLEAVAWLATMRSMRGAPREALVRDDRPNAVVRAELETAGRAVLIEAELGRTGPQRVQVNRQPTRRRAELAAVLRVTVFSPDDLHLVQGGPALRRDYLDDTLVSRHVRNENLVLEVERILRQRTALLRQAGGRLSEDVNATLAVWDARLGTQGSDLAERREALAEELAPLVASAYARLAGVDAAVGLSYRRSWEGNLVDALAAGRADDLRRQATGVGPHRDELEIVIGSRPARTRASQGEQRSVALALRLATHELARATDPEPPVLLLDDVFSELDPQRAIALVALLPPGQVLLTTAVDPPAGISPERVVRVDDGRLVDAGDRR
jgi:DNA replication and repair protein RecF